MKINFSNAIVASITLLVIVCLLLTSRNLAGRDPFALVPTPIPEPSYLEEHIDFLDRDLIDRRQAYQKQIIWDIQELNRKISQLKQQSNCIENTLNRKQFDELLKQESVVQQKIEFFLTTGEKNWEEAGFIADEELKKLQQSYDQIYQVITKDILQKSLPQKDCKIENLNLNIDVVKYF